MAFRLLSRAAPPVGRFPGGAAARLFSKDAARGSTTGAHRMFSTTLEGSSDEVAEVVEGVDDAGSSWGSSTQESAPPSKGLPKQTQKLVRYEDIARANYRIKDGIVRTELKRSYWLSKLCGCNVYLKMELTQFTGSFKERGARNSLLMMSDEQRARGVIAASAGNHALAMAWHGKSLDVDVTVLMPTVAPLAKVEKCRSFGANVVIHGANIAEAKAHAESAPEYEGMRYVNGYDDIEIISGAGTMGVEILEQLPETDVVIIPTGGAGLLAGTSLAMKTLKPSVEVLGVETKACPSYTAAMAAGYPVPVKTTSTLADGLAVPTVGSNAFEVARENTDEVVQVDEADVALAMLRLVETEKLVVEGGGATGLAGILPGMPLHERVQGKNVVVPLCGGNIDTTTLGRVIERGLAADERLVRFVAQVSDMPGGIANLTKLLAEQGASIKDIYHERAWLSTTVAKVQVKCVIETVGKEHAETIRLALCRKYPVSWQPISDWEGPYDKTSRSSALDE